eukprot:CCRYP_004006-RB/>CCRYP_004006-RB protein AED:0.04 eAED:0.04 QI:239/1/1/1/1/1/2/609/132
MFNILANSAARRAIAASSIRATSIPSMVARALFSDDATAKVKGTVKWFDAKKGFGFLIPDDGSQEVFVHHSAIHASGFRSLGDGEPVEFEVLQEPNGRWKALNVTGPDGAYVQGCVFLLGIKLSITPHLLNF